MHTEHSPIDDRPQTHIIEHFTTIPPNARTSILFHAFVVEPVHLCDLSRFVVPSNQGHSIGVADFEREEEEECFDGVEPSINVVACERTTLKGSVEIHREIK